MRVRERLDHIRNCIDDARENGGRYSSNHVELEWLIEQAERTQKFKKDAQIANRHKEMLAESNRGYQELIKELESEIEELGRAYETLSRERLVLNTK